MKTALLTLATMVAFAANSLLCRMALGNDLIDAASFTSVRILAGAITLGAITIPGARRSQFRPNWQSISALCVYMIFFSFAYISLSAGTGALILFGMVQLTMYTAALRAGERFRLPAWLGIGTAFAGLAYLVAPGVTAPDPAGAAFMAIAGVAWGIYSLIGRDADSPLTATASNFLYSIPFAVGLSALFIDEAALSGAGLVLAAASGAIASGIGYTIWYAALANLTASRAATVQLSVPVIAAIGGVVFLSELVTWRLLIASALTLGGIWLVLARGTLSASSERG